MSIFKTLSTRALKLNYNLLYNNWTKYLCVIWLYVNFLKTADQRVEVETFVLEKRKNRKKSRCNVIPYTLKYRIQPSNLQNHNYFTLFQLPTRRETVLKLSSVPPISTQCQPWRPYLPYHLRACFPYQN